MKPFTLADFVKSLVFVLFGGNITDTSLVHKHNPPASDLTLASSTQQNIEIAWKVYELVNDWIRFSDNKAAAILAADGVIIAAIATWLSGSHSHSTNTVFGITWTSSIIISVFYSSSHALMSLLPRLTISNRLKSLVYFRDIASDFAEPRAYAVKMNALLTSSDDFLQEIAHQIWSNSVVADTKYRHVIAAVRGLAWTCIVGFAGIVWLVVLNLSSK